MGEACFTSKEKPTIKSKQQVTTCQFPSRLHSTRGRSRRRGGSRWTRRWQAAWSTSSRRKKQRRSSQSISFRSNLVSLANWGSLANLEVSSLLSWGLLLWRQPSHFWRPSLRLARTILPRMVRNSLEKEEITRQRKSKCQHKRKRLRKRRRRTLSQKRERKWRPKTTLRKTQTSK